MRLPPILTRHATAIVTVLGLAGVAVLLWRTGWLSDDAYITLRTVDNVVNGYGPRWNVVERVQSFTHPLWMFLIVPFYFVTREPLYTVIALQSAITLVTIWLLSQRIAPGPIAAVAGIGAFASSRSLVDFSTSGLENALVHLLLVLFVITWRRGRDAMAFVQLGLLTSALLLCRLDLGVLLAPMLIAVLLPLQRSRVIAFARGLVPFLAWEVFSLFYYGMLIPNTALAKLPLGVPRSELIAQGLRYWPGTFHHDPVTIVLLAATALLLVSVAGSRGRFVAAGMLLHVTLMTSMGGDFMFGRFLTPALMLGLTATLAFAGDRGPLPLRALVAAAAVIVALAHRGHAALARQLRRARYDPRIVSVSGRRGRAQVLLPVPGSAAAAGGHRASTPMDVPRTGYANAEDPGRHPRQRRTGRVPCRPADLCH